MAYSFTTNGSVPSSTSQLNLTSGGSSTIGNSPFAKALSTTMINPGGQVVPQNLGIHAPPVPAAAPSTPVKSTVVQHPDGSSQTTTYHAPTPGMLPGASKPAATNASDIKTAGQSFTDTQGNAGTAAFDPMTGKSLTASAAPVTASPTTSATSTAGSTNQGVTYPGLVGNLAGTAQTGSTAGQDYTKQTADYGKGNLDIGKSAADIAADYGHKIAQAGQQGAAFEAGQLTTGTSPVAEGNAAITAQSTAAQQQALATGEEAALQGTGQQLTAQNQAGNAANEAAGQSNTAQNLQQSGLTSAATLAQPSATAQGQTTFNPLTGQFSGGSYQNNLATVVQAIKNGSIGYTDGVNSLAGLSPTAKADVLAQLGQGFDTVASDANASARGSNISTGGTAVTGANAAGLADSIKQETELNTAAQNAQALASQVSTAIQNAGLNLTNSTDANTAINNLQSRLGNAAYTQLNIAVNDARSQYAAILQSTGAATPTEAGNMANENISANMSPKQILAAIDQLNAGVKARQDAAHSQTTQYQNQLKGSGSQTTGSSQGGGTTVQTKYGAINTSW